MTTTEKSDTRAKYPHIMDSLPTLNVPNGDTKLQMSR